MLILLLAAAVTAIDFLPRGDINGKNVWNIYGFPWINGSNGYYSGNVTASNFIGSVIGNVSWTSVVGRPTHLSNFTDDLDTSNYSVNYSSYSNSSVYANSSDYWDNLGSSSDITTLGALGSLDVNGAADFADSVTIHDNLDMNGTNISNADTITAGFFSGNGSLLTAITALWTSITGRPTHLSNFTNDLGIGNWSADKASYYNASTTDSQIVAANSSMKDYVDAINFTEVNVNNSNSTDYWDNLNTPADITSLGAIQHTGSVDMNSKNITNVDWLFVHNVSGYSPITINSNLELGANNVTTTGKFSGDGSLLSAITAAWTSITGRPTHLSNFTDDIGAGNQSIPPESVTRTSFNYTEISSDDLKMQTDFLPPMCNLSLTPSSSQNYYREFSQDSNGCLNTIDTSLTTATFSVNKYMWGGENDDTTTQSTSGADGGTENGVCFNVTIAGGAYLLGVSRVVGVNINTANLYNCTSSACSTRNFAATTDNITGNYLYFNASQPFMSYGNYYCLGMAGGTRYYNSGAAYPYAKTYVTFMNGVWGGAINPTVIANIQNISMIKNTSAAVVVDLPAFTDTAVLKTALYATKPTAFVSGQSITYELVDSDGVVQGGLAEDTLNTINGVDASKLFGGDGKLRILINNNNVLATPAVQTWALGLWR